MLDGPTYRNNVSGRRGKESRGARRTRRTIDTSGRRAAGTCCCPRAVFRRPCFKTSHRRASCSTQHVHEGGAVSSFASKYARTGHDRPHNIGRVKLYQLLTRMICAIISNGDKVSGKICGDNIKGRLGKLQVAKPRPRRVLHSTILEMTGPYHNDAAHNGLREVATKRHDTVGRCYQERPYVTQGRKVDYLKVLSRIARHTPSAYFVPAEKIARPRTDAAAPTDFSTRRLNSGLCCFDPDCSNTESVCGTIDGTGEYHTCRLRTQYVPYTNFN